MPDPYLEDVEDIPGAALVNIPVSFTRFGATHDVSVTEAYDRLRVAFITDLQKTMAEVRHRYAINGDLVALSVPCFITVPNGIFRLVTARTNGDSVEVLSFELKPKLGFIVPEGVGFALQSVVHQRATFVIEHSRHGFSSRVVLPYDHPDVAERWEQDLPNEPFVLNPPVPARTAPE